LSRRPTPALLGLLALPFLTVGSVPASAEPPVDGDSAATHERHVSGPGSWPLVRLGYGDTSVETSRERSSVTFKYEAMSGARQGPETWWHLRLHFRVRFTRQPDRAVYVSASTQGRAAAQVKFEPDPADPSLVRWSSVTLTGRMEQSAPWVEEIEVDTSNYLQYEGVSAGENTLEVALEQPAETAVGELAVLDSTAIIVDTDSPFDLRLEVRPSKSKVHEGDRFTLPFSVINSDAEPARDVELRVQVLPTDGLSFAGQAHRPGRATTRLQWAWACSPRARTGRSLCWRSGRASTTSW
jgi:hypothetical protein